MCQNNVKCAKIRKKVAETFLNAVIRKNGIKSPISIDVIELILKYEGTAEYDMICDDYSTIQVIVGNQYSAWIGGSMIASEDQFESQWITKEQYDKQGHGVAY